MKNIIFYIQNHSIKAFENLIDNYMLLEVDGDKYKKEKGFENDVRDLLLGNGFIVLPKKNVKNSLNIIGESTNSNNIDRKVPDIVIECDDGIVFMELKYCARPQEYNEDIKALQKFIKENKCDAAYVLFLDEVTRQGWIKCKKNPEYNFLFNEARASFPQI